MKEEFFIINHPIHGIGVATEIKTPFGVKNKYHVAYRGIMVPAFFERGQYEELCRLPESEDGFNRDKYNRLT